VDERDADPANHNAGPALVAAASSDSVKSRRYRRDAQPLLPTSVRRPAAVVLGCAALILASGTVCVHEEYADPLDRRVDLWATAHLGGHGRALQLIADLGQKYQVIVIISIMFLICLVTRRANGAVLAATGTPAAAVLTEKVFKPLVSHLYIYASYPSGHTSSAFAMVTTTTVLLASAPGLSSKRAWPALRTAIVATAVLVGCAIAVAVTGLGYHRFIDAVGGAAAGIAVVLTGTFILDLPVSRRILSLHRWRERLTIRTSSG